MKKLLLSIITGAILFMLLSTSISVSAYSMSLKSQGNSSSNPDFIEKSIFNNINNLGPDWYHKPSNYAELVSWYQTLESNYSGYLEVFKANEMYGTGNVSGGYDLYYIRITNESLGFHKPEVLFLGSPHGDETVGTIGLYWFTDWLMRMAFTDEPCQEYSKEWLQWLIDNREIYIEVSHNPYGFDHGPQRYDANGWDLNREADFDGPGSPTGGIWGSVNGRTLRRFIDNHTIRVGCDFHGGVRMLLYPWASTHTSVIGTSPISGESYSAAPPDFYFYDVEALRLGDFMGNPSGEDYFDEYNTGTIDELIWYSVYGGIAPWAYGADVIRNPVEDPYVEDETFGNYPGAGLLWISPEMSVTKNPSESYFGNDTTPGFGAEVRRFVLHQSDIAQPYVRWQPGTVQNHMVVEPGTAITLEWQVNGSLVVDHTYLQWGTNPNPVNNYSQTTPDHDENEGEYIGGTGWDNANNGATDGITYSENITLNSSGDYYFVAKAQVDQIYGNVLRPDVYDNDSYLRLVRERTNDTYYESLNGSDGTEEIFGQTWWYSPIIHITIEGNVHVTDLIDKWNFISLPFNQSVDIADIIVKYNGSDYTWAEATDPSNGPIVDPNIYGWDRILHMYFQVSDALEPGYGYWIYAYFDCELWVENISATPDTYITNLKMGWNAMDAPSDQPVDLVNLTVNYGGTDYTWTAATGIPIVDPNVYGWDRSLDMYVPATTMEPGYAYWMYAYDNCTLRKTGI